MSATTKPIKSAEELVAHMQEKGITFDIVSPEDAAKYMENNNNYFRVASYRKNYNKQLDENQKPIDKYVNLDFGYLQDLAIIDMELRYTFLQLSLDIEHFAKMELLREIEVRGEDGYQIVKDYMNSLDEKQQEHLQKELKQNENSTYTSEIYNKYKSNLPVWVFLELVPFGTILYFYRFCATRFSLKNMQKYVFILLQCKNIRNACAHSDCIINDLHRNTSRYSTSYLITKNLSNIHGLNRDICANQMSNERIQGLICILFMHSKIVTSEGVHNKAAHKLHAFETRMLRHPDYYTSNSLISSTFGFLQLVIDNWFQIN
jgi:abortive infection bacteriophage resistance protein